MWVFLHYIGPLVKLFLQTLFLQKIRSNKNKSGSFRGNCDRVVWAYDVTGHDLTTLRVSSARFDQSYIKSVAVVHSRSSRLLATLKATKRKMKTVV